VQQLPIVCAADVRVLPGEDGVEHGVLGLLDRGVREVDGERGVGPWTEGVQRRFAASGEIVASDERLAAGGDSC
jgi:hypothetical protein